MPRTLCLLAGLGAALVIGGFAAAVRTEATPRFRQTPWVVQEVQNASGGQVYRLNGCFIVTAPGVEFVSLRVVWYAQENGYGSAVYQEDVTGNAALVGSEQCLSLPEVEAPCAARSARYGVVATGETEAVTVSSVDFAPEPGATPIPCPTPTPTSTAVPSPTATTPTPPPPTPTPSPTPSPTAPAATAESAAEPPIFSSLVNGGFEDVREDGTPSATIVKLRRAYAVLCWPIEECASPTPDTLRRTWRGMDSVTALGADGHAGQ